MAGPQPREVSRRVSLARAVLGERWLGRALTQAELAAALRLAPTSETIMRWENQHGRSRGAGPAMVAIELMLAGATPAHVQAWIAKCRGT